VCKPSGETDADLTAEDGLTMVDALEDVGDVMEVEDRAASSSCNVQRPTSRNWCSDYRWFTEQCNQKAKGSIFNAKQNCNGVVPYDRCLYYYISTHRYPKSAYCWPCNCRGIYTIGCEQGSLTNQLSSYLLGKFQCYS